MRKGSLVKQAVWSATMDEALAELLLLCQDEDEAAAAFSELHHLPISEVRERIQAIKRRARTEQVGEVDLSPATVVALGLQKRVPMKFKRQMAEFLGYAIEAMNDLRPLAVPISQTTPGKESLCLLLGDWHIGAFVNLAVNQYNQEVAKRRVQRLIHNTIKLSHEFIKQDIQELVVLIVGDMVDGAEIFDTQPYHQELMVLDQIRLASSLLWQMLQTFVRYYPRVRVHAVRGNHGRMSRTAPPEANWDLALYLLLKMMLEIAKQGRLEGFDKLEIHFSTEEFDNVLINGKQVQIRHEAPKQTETPAGSSVFSGYHDISPYHIICYGHYHHPGIEWHQDRPVIKNGSLMGPNELSNRIAKLSSPKQYLFSIPADQDKVISFSYPIFLGEARIRRYAEEKDSDSR